MRVKGTKQLGSFKRGIDLYVPKKISVPSAQGGIPVSTTIIIINGITLEKTPDGIVQFAGGQKESGSMWMDISGITILVSPDFTYSGPAGMADFGFTWAYILNSTESPPPITSSNPSTNLNFIPITNWSPSITIAAG